MRADRASMLASVAAIAVIAAVVVAAAQRPIPRPAPSPPTMARPVEPPKAATPAPSATAVRLPPPPTPPARLARPAERAPRPAETSPPQRGADPQPPVRALKPAEAPRAESAPPPAALPPLKPMPLAQEPGLTVPAAPKEMPPAPSKVVEPLRPSEAAVTRDSPAPAPDEAPAMREAAPPRTPPAAREKPGDDAPTVAVAARPEAVAEGRVLLRLLEHGKGPSITIAWPADPARDAALYQALRRCYGMRGALVDRANRLRVEGEPGADGLDLDRYSGYVREPTGALPPEEASTMRRAAEALGVRWPAPALRIFPREVDAGLLGGLARLTGPDGRRARITARYELRGSVVVVTGVTINGRPVAGAVALAPTRPGCR